jgi:hypothetical protein
MKLEEVLKCYICTVLINYWFSYVNISIAMIHAFLNFIKQE